MSQLLTSWKEIAKHFGKGVRTVQRWEAKLGLPIHRPDTGAHNIVFAFPEELNLWVTRFAPKLAEDGESQHSALLLRLRELELENSTLRQKLNALTSESSRPKGDTQQTLN